MMVNFLKKKYLRSSMMIRRNSIAQKELLVATGNLQLTPNWISDFTHPYFCVEPCFPKCSWPFLEMGFERRSYGVALRL